MEIIKWSQICFKWKQPKSNINFCHWKLCPIFWNNFCIHYLNHRYSHVIRKNSKHVTCDSQNIKIFQKTYYYCVSISSVFIFQIWKKKPILYQFVIEQNALLDFSVSHTGWKTSRLESADYVLQTIISPSLFLSLTVSLILHLRHRVHRLRLVVSQSRS